MRYEKRVAPVNSRRGPSYVVSVGEDRPLVTINYRLVTINYRSGISICW